MEILKKKSVIIGPHTFKVRWNNESYAGSFDFASEEIEIGCAGPDSRTLEVLLHELSEIVHVILHNRLHRPDVADDYVFVMDHAKFDSHNAILTGLIPQFIK